MFQADVFEHADTGDAIKCAFDIPIILQADLDLIFEARCLDTLSGQIILVLRERHAKASCTVFLRCADDKCPPATADIQQSLPRFDLDFCQDMIDFFQLRGGQVFVTVFEIGAGIHHVRVQPFCIKLIRYVIVVLNGLFVDFLGVREALRQSRQAPCWLQGFMGEVMRQINDIGQPALDVDFSFHISRAQIRE